MRTSFGDLLADLVIEALTEGPRTGFEIATILEDRFGTSLRTGDGVLEQQSYRFFPSLRGREGALYTELMQLERKGFIEGEWSEEPEGWRRTYRLPVLVDLNALTAPETTVPETTVPETPVPETPVPETDVPEIEE